MDSKLRCVFMVEDGHAESGNYEGANNEFSTAKSDLPVKATTALSSSPKVLRIFILTIVSFVITYTTTVVLNQGAAEPLDAAKSSRGAANI